MEVKELLSKAQEFALKVSEAFPEFAAVPDAAVTLIAIDRGGIVSGSTGIRYDDGEAKYSDSAEQAVRAIPGAMIASAMVTVKIADCAVVEPAEDVLKQLVQANMANAACIVATSDTESKEVSAIIPVSHEAVSDFLSGFDDAVSAPAPAKKQLGQQSEFVGGIQIDESNPFFAAPNTATDDVKTIDAENAQNAPYPQQGAMQQPNPAAGFQFPVFNGKPAGYTQQQGGYPQRGGDPPQGG